MTDNSVTVPVVWVELPVTDIERAEAFWRAVMEIAPTEIKPDGPRMIATIFGGDQSGRAGFSLTKVANFNPSPDGPLPYIYVASVDDALKRVEAAGGKVVIGKTMMMPDNPEAGFYATFTDTEGNTIAFYGA